MLKLFLLVCLVAAVISQGTPPFLANAPAATQQAFQQLMAGAGDKTDSQVDQMVQDWVAQQDPSIQSAFASFVADVKAAQAKGEAAHAAAVANFSPAAKEADAKLSAIAADPTLTMQQKGSQINDLLNSLPADVRQEIETAMKG